MQAILHPHFFLDLLSIVLIDLLLAGDNALVIAMVVRGLPGRQRRAAIFSGAGLAVLLRVALTFVAARLLTVEFVQLAGGLLILWIAVKVLLDAGGAEGPQTPLPCGLLRAIGLLVVADLTMSTDNILAVAGASRGNLFLIVFGLCLSIPLVVFSSTLLSVLMDRYSWIVYVGAAILGRVGGEMVLTDPFVARWLHPAAALRYTTEAVLAMAIVLAGRWLRQEPPRHEPVEATCAVDTLPAENRHDRRAAERR